MKIIKVRGIAKNVTEVQVDECVNPALWGIVQVLVSYETAVLVKTGLHIFETKQYHSRTTDRHIKKWLEGYPHIPAENFHTIPQWEIDEVLDGGPVFGTHYAEFAGWTPA